MPFHTRDLSEEVVDTPEPSGGLPRVSVVSSSQDMSLLAEPVTGASARPWQRTYAMALVTGDALVVGGVITAGTVLTGNTRETDTLIIAIAMATGWIALLSWQHAYDIRFLATGPMEYQRVARASVTLLAVIATLSFATGWNMDRDIVGYVVASGLALLVLERNIARRLVHALRQRGACSFRVLAVGDRRQVTHLVNAMQGRQRDAGFTVVAACTCDGGGDAIGSVPVMGGIHRAVPTARQIDADVMVVTPCEDISHEDLQELAWALYGSDIDLALAPSLTSIAGPRISIRPVSGLPLLYVAQPKMSTVPRMIKNVSERILAAVSLIIAAPLLILIATWIRLDSKGPVFFWQNRVGKDGQLFRMWKFRTMTPDAESQMAALKATNEADGLLFKIKADPRVTRAGTWLRRWSIDEIPQLVNVLKGDMSLIGPRPLPVSLEDFRGPERHRLLVKPGITGLWQVSGRSDTTWEETVQLDLYYVANWSFSLDFVILCKTIFSVLRNKGAY